MPLEKLVEDKPPTSKNKIFNYKEQFGLECGQSLSGLNIAYTTYGKLNANKDNVVWVFHALTANADPVEWWPGLVGKSFIIDPQKYFIVCANMLGSCYGTTGPDGINDLTGKKYGVDFPLVTIKDMVNAHRLLKKYLGISRIYLGIGGSMGGQQLLEWACQEGGLFEHACLLATNARHSAWGIAFNSAQRMAMEADPTLFTNKKNAGVKGLQAARAVAMLSYRNQNTYRKTQTDFEDKLDGFKAESYQRYQGLKLSKRFTPLSYWYLSKAMDSHNVGRRMGSAPKALKNIKTRTLAIGIKGDILFPIAEQQFIHKHIANAEFKLIHSSYGHDGFLIEAEKISNALNEFLNKESNGQT